MRSATYIGTVQDVDGSSVAIAIDATVPNGLVFVNGEPHQIAQVGGFAKVTIGFTDLIGVVTRVGAGAAPHSDEESGNRWMSIQLVGESRSGNAFSRGVSQLPNIGDRAHLVTEADLKKIYGAFEAANGYVDIGRVASAESISARLNLNQLVTRHSAVVGSTGSGKSTTVATLIEAVSDSYHFPSSRVLLFDLHGEYARSLGSLANVFTLQDKPSPDTRALRIPYWALSFDELLPLTFVSLPDEAGRASVRDEIVRLKRQSLTNHSRAGISAEDVTVDSPIPFSIKQLWFDLHVLVNATHTSQGSAQNQSTWALEMDAAGLPIEPGDAAKVVGPLFRPQSQAAGAEKIYLSSSTLNIRRQVDILGSRLRDRRFDFVLNPGDWAPGLDGTVSNDLDTLLEQWLGSSRSVSIIDLSNAPQAVVAELVGSLTRLVYDAMYWARLMSEGTRERPLLIVFEEAHSYLGADSRGAAKTSVQRIVREGRKYGIGAMVVSQRPSEIDATILSQCGTVIAMRLTNSQDRMQIVAAASDNMSGMLSMLPVLRTGEAIIIGESVPIPMRALIQPPANRPDSFDPVLVNSNEAGGWDKKREPANYEGVVMAWRSQNARSPEIVSASNETQE